jgi:hypothetical protein
MDPQHQKYFETLTNTLDTLLKVSNMELWTRFHSVLELSIKTFHHLAHKTNFKFKSKEHSEHVFLTLAFLITNLVFYTGTKQKQLEGGVRIHFQRGRNQRPRTHKVHHRQNRPHARTFKERNRKWLANQWEKLEVEKIEAKRRVAIILAAESAEPASEAQVSDMAHSDKPNWIWCLLIICFRLAPMCYLPKPLIPRITEKSGVRSSRSLVTLSRSRNPLVKQRESIDVEHAIQLLHPNIAAAELISGLKEAGKIPTHTPSGAKCLTVKPIPLNGTAVFPVQDIETINNLLLASFANYSIGEFGGLIVQEPKGELRFFKAFEKGERGKTHQPYHNNYNKTVGRFHMHPLDIDRVQSPPSRADIRIYIQDAVFKGIPYDFISTSTGFFIIHLQDNALEQINKMYSIYSKAEETYNNAKDLFRNLYAKEQARVGIGNPVTHLFPEFIPYQDAKAIFKPLKNDMKLLYGALNSTTIIDKIYSETYTTMEHCTHLPSGLLSVGQDIIDIDIQTANFGNIKMTTGIDIKFVNITDLLAKRMPQLPWIQKFSIQPSSSGTTGTKLIDDLVSIYDMGFSDSMRILRNQTVPGSPANLIANAWIQLTPEQQKEFLVSLHANYSLAEMKMFLSKGESSRPMLRELVHENLLSRPENLVESMKAHKSGGGKSILDTPGIITKMVFGNEAKETMFMNLPYPLNLLKKYI